MRLTDHFFDAPLDFRMPDGEQLTIFAREVVDPGRFPDPAELAQAP